MARKRTKVGKYKTVFRGTRFRIEQATATHPSGKTEIFERIHKEPGAVIFAFDSRQRVLVTREWRNHHHQYEWRFPAGGSKKNESLFDTAQRELQEEAGFRARRIKKYYEFENSSGFVKKRAAFIATDLVPSRLEGDEDEDIRTYFMPLSKVFKMVLDGKIEHPYYAFMILKLHREWKHVKKWLNSH